MEKDLGPAPMKTLQDQPSIMKESIEGKNRRPLLCHGAWSRLNPSTNRQRLQGHSTPRPQQAVQ
jgi:hypothetical protein